jgi:hypothetical protein
MNADLTFNTIVFKKSFDEKDGSERRSTARGINTPDVMSIKSQDYVDSATKLPGKRYTARVDRTTIDANLQSITTSCYFVFVVPGTAVAGDVTDVTTTFKALVADANFMANVLNNEK